VEKLKLHMDLLKAIDQKLLEDCLTVPQGVGFLEQDIACGVDSIAKEVHMGLSRNSPGSVYLFLSPLTCQSISINPGSFQMD